MLSDLRRAAKSVDPGSVDAPLFDPKSQLFFFIGDGNITAIPFIEDTPYQIVYDWVLLKKQKIANEILSQIASLKSVKTK